MATLNLNKKKFIDEENLKTIVKIGINFGEKLNALEAETITDYDETKTYLKGESCYYDNYVYRCKSTATGEWNPDRWTLIGDDITELTLDEIKAMLGLTTEQLTTLSSIILDSEVRLDKTYSSSKIYTSIQNAIDTAKAYTLAEIGKASGASYKIASSTSDMTDEKIIYLLNNGTNFDMYIVDNGTPTKIGDTNIDLSGYLKIDEANNIYLKKTDATSTYATKVELNGKADATALDDKVDKTDIVTTIDSTSTDEQIPSAKLLYDNSKVSDVVNLISYVNTDLFDITNATVNVIKCGRHVQLNIQALLFKQEMEGLTNLLILNAIPKEYRPLVLTETTMYSTNNNMSGRGFLDADGKLYNFFYYDGLKGSPKIGGFLFGTFNYISAI